jgi:putative hydrolase of the HAD superfamily
MPARLKFIFIDLDNTLWDFDGNAGIALTELFHRHDLHLRSGRQAHEFVDMYRAINEAFWKEYEVGKIDKNFLRTQRFTETFKKLGIPESEHPENAWEEYLDICPRMPGMLPGAMDMLIALRAKFKLAILSNGFQKTQDLKLDSSGIRAHIEFMLTSEGAGIAKPEPDFFARALELAGIDPAGGAEECLYIGDTWRTDIAGAVLAGVPAIWFNPRRLAPESRPGQDAGPILNSPLYLGEFSELPAIRDFILGL